MKSWRLIFVVSIIAFAIALWIFSYPTVLGLGYKPTPMVPIDPAPPSTSPTHVLRKSWLNYWERGRTLTFRHDLGKAAYIVILWKGSIHFQRRADIDHLGFDQGCHISRSATVMYSTEEHWSGQELYWENARAHFLGAAWVNYPIAYGGVTGNMTAVALPLWLGILAFLTPAIFRFLRNRQRRRGFEVVTK